MDNTYTVGSNGVRLNPVDQAASKGLTALRVQNGMPTIDLAPVEVTAPINMTRYGMRRENPKYAKVKEIEAWYGVDAARDYLYGTQLSDLSDKMGEVFSEGLIAAGTADIPLGKLFQKAPVLSTVEKTAGKTVLGKGYNIFRSVGKTAKEDLIPSAEHPTLIQQARMSTPEMKEKFINQLPTEDKKKGWQVFKEMFEGEGSTTYKDYLDDVYEVTDLHTRKENSALGFSTRMGDPGSVQVGMRSQDFLGTFGKRATNMEKAMVEAHEKTHGMVDNFSDAMKTDLKNSTTSQRIGGYKKAEFYDEMLPRMAMFKNALGMNGNQEFTKASMDLLRETYKSLPMSYDFKKVFNIVPKNSPQEAQFIKNMNKYAFAGAGAVVAGTGLTKKAFGGQLGPGADPANMGLSLEQIRARKLQQFAKDHPTYKKKEGYEPAPSIKYVKGAAALGSVAPNPWIAIPSKIVGTVGDLYTGTRYIMDGQTRAGLTDYGEALVGLIPFGKQMTKAARAKNTALAVAKGAADVDDATTAIEAATNQLTAPKKKAMGGKVESRYVANLNDQAKGGTITPLSQNSGKINGPSHKQGGVDLPEYNAEVEGKESIADDYIFSHQLGFAQKHIPLAKAKGKIEAKPRTQERVNALARLQAGENRLKQEQELVKQAQQWQ